MGRKQQLSPDQKMRIVLSVLRGEVTQTAIARKLEMSQTTIAKWQKQALVGMSEALTRGDNPKPPSSVRERELESQVEELTTAIGEAYVELRVWRKGGTLYPRSQTSRWSAPTRG
jgi:transposase